MTSRTKPAPTRGRWSCPSHSMRPASPRPQRRDCQGQLLAALDALKPPTGSIVDASLRPWCSAPFMGAHHRISLRIGGPEAEQQAVALAEMLPGKEFTIRGHVVAEIAVDAITPVDEGSIEINLAVLTIEDW